MIDFKAAEEKRLLIRTQLDLLHIALLKENKNEIMRAFHAIRILSDQALDDVIKAVDDA